MRRALDVLFVIVTAPVVVLMGSLIALAVFLDSPGPVFYRSERVGWHGRPLRMLKFRKMRREASGAGVTGFADARLTPIGRFLQATRLDELPQFWHVLRGEMSIVGPRPELREFVALHATEYDEILCARPGLTGYVQVQFIEESHLLAAAVRYEEILPEKVALDLAYVRGRGRWTDAAILARTLALPFTVAWHRAVRLAHRHARGVLVAWGVGAVGVLALLATFAAQAGSLR